MASELNVGTIKASNNVEVTRTGGKAFVTLEKTGEASKFTTATGVAVGAFSIIDENAAGGSDVAKTRLSIDSAGLATFSNGIAFTQTDTSATGAAATSTTLDHYEEGTWTPGFDTTAGDLANFTDYNAVGYYTRIGRLVVCLCAIGTTGAGSISGTGTVQIKGLPFAAVGNRSAIVLTGGRWTTQPAYGYIGATTSTDIDLRQDFNTVTAVADFTASASDNQNVLEFVCSYIV